MKKSQSDKLVQMGFSADQINEIREGLEAGVDVTVFAKKELLAIQMRQIRLGLTEGLPVEIYAHESYDWFQMEEIREGLKAGIDVSKYASPDIPYDKMRQMRKGLQDGVDLTGYLQLDAGIIRQLRKAIRSDVDILQFVQDGYSAEQLQVIRVDMQNEINIAPYLTKELRGVSIAEISKGLHNGIDVSVYAKADYSWQQMRELRLGIENRVDTSLYASPYYSWQQMQEIRLGLENGIDVSDYRSLMHTTAEMRKIRIRLQEDVLHELIKCEERIEKNKNILISVASDEMGAYVELHKGEKEPTKATVMQELKRMGVVYGICEQKIEEMLSKKIYNQKILVAEGVKPQNGADGRYEYFFRTSLKKTPKLLPDGSADYQNIEWFESVDNGQKIAYYHAAEEGKNGNTVTGRELKAKRGKEKSVLTGKGFLLMPDHKTYIAGVTGKVELAENENRLEITRLLVLEDMTLATANVIFDGSVHVKGNVGTGAVIKATEDILVEGYMEAAQLQSGGNIVLKQGANGAGTGCIKAGKGIIGKFFEAVRLQASEDIQANYCLNCELSTEGHIIIAGGNGLLAGGSAYAAKGIRTCHMGNRAGIATYIKLGIDESLLREQVNILNHVQEVNKELTILNHAYIDFQKKYPPEIRNTMDLYLKVESAIYTKEKQLESLYASDAQIRERITKTKDVRLIVKGNLHEGVHVNINGRKWDSKMMRNVTVKRVDDRIAVYAN